MIMIGFAGLALVAAAAILARGRGAAAADAASSDPPATGDEPGRLTRPDSVSKENWRMPALTMLAPAPMSIARRVGMTGMWVYLAIAMGAVVVRIIEVAAGH